MSSRYASPKSRLNLTITSRVLETARELDVVPRGNISFFVEALLQAQTSKILRDYAEPFKCECGAEFSAYENGNCPSCRRLLTLADRERITDAAIKKRRDEVRLR